MYYNLQQGKIEINTVIFDLNGTLSEYGEIKKEIRQWIEKLKETGFSLILLTSDQRGNAKRIAKELQIDYHIVKTSEGKRKFVQQLNKPFFAIGNARNDIPMFQEATIAIATLQSEGIHSVILEFVDILVTSITDAFRLISDENGLVSTMKK